MTRTAIQRGVTAGLIGGAAWVLFPWATPLAETEDGSTPVLGDVGSGLYFALLLVVPVALLLMGLAGLHALHRDRYGRLGRVGAGITAVGLAGMLVGLGWEATTITATGEESTFGYAFWMIGFLLLLPGSVVLGLAVRRARVLPGARAAGVALVLAIPVAIALSAVAGTVLPGQTGFWVGLTVPYGLTWLLLATGMRAVRVAPARRTATVA